ncbi:WxL domain-containing protein [Clostridia bacterium OttesenSCG-928-O13]|nr:WxL domain-containing protein [Clostridia bacterium OttesenSCG-928-O13]
MTKLKTITGKLILPLVLAFVAAVSLFALPVYAAESENDTAETEASVSFEAGELKLQTAPTLFFGDDHPISNKEETYTAQSVGDNVRISDLRGNGAGWNLRVSLSQFTLDGTDGTETLHGATITTTAPTVKAVNNNLGTPPAQVTEVVLESDGVEAAVWNAPKGTGMGVWDLEWHAADTKLTVKPGTAQQGKSVASLNWSLQNTP